MLKLAYLFSNFDLAEMLLRNWDYDEDSLALFKYFRISANAIYPFKQAGQVCFLRCSPCSEKRKDNLLAELDFIQYLRRTGYPAMQPLPGKSGELLLTRQTPWGEYYASAFQRVKGEPLSETNFDEQVVLSYGRALGQLHALSATYDPPTARRWTHADVLNWIGVELKLLPPDPPARNELSMLRDYFSRLPITSANYGLVHFDFEIDNVFYDSHSGLCSVIDFDDAMYHWYVMDIVGALDSLKRAAPADAFAQNKALFLSAYSAQFAIDDDLLAALPHFRRFANLVRYTRIQRTIQEHWDNEPEWMLELRHKLDQAMKTDAAAFGKAMYM
jgi:Ser/Thr protein kinase RdoA (MazF antagonist)